MASSALGSRVGLVVLAAASVGLAWLTSTPLGASPSMVASDPSSILAGYSFAPSSLMGGGFVNVVVADPRHNGVVLAGADTAGIERSTDFGLTWQAANGGHVAGNMTVSAITFDPASPDTVYAAFDSGVFESTDDGVTWAALPTGPTFNGGDTGTPNGSYGQERCTGRLLAVDDSSTPPLVYAASFDDGLWRYDGQDWTQIVTQAQLGGAPCNTSLAWAPGGSLDVAVWADSGAGVFNVAQPSGSPVVTPVPDAPPAVHDLVSLSDGDVWGAAYTTGVGVIAGGTWTTTLTGSGEHYLSIDGYVTGSAPDTSDVVYAGSDNSVTVSGSLHATLHLTTDSGATWSELPSTSTVVSTQLMEPGQTSGVTWWQLPTVNPSALFGNKTYIPTSITVEHEAGGDDIWVGGSSGVWRELGAEGSSTFYPADYALDNTVLHQVVVDPTSDGATRSGQGVYVGDTDWSAFGSTDGFTTQPGIDELAPPGSGSTGYATVVDPSTSPPTLYVGTGARDTDTQGDVYSAALPATAGAAFTSTGFRAAVGGARPLAVAVVDTSGTPASTTLIAPADGDGLWLKVGPGPWTKDTADGSLFATAQGPTSVVVVPGTSTVYAYDRTTGVYRSDTGGTPGSWTLVWPHPSPSNQPTLLVDQTDPSRLWVSAQGGLFRLDGADNSTFPASLAPVLNGASEGLAEYEGQIITVQQSTDGYGLEVSDPTESVFQNLADPVLEATLPTVVSMAVGGDGTLYLATQGNGLLVGTPSFTSAYVYPTATTLTSSSALVAPATTVTLTATVADAVGTPTGTVTFEDGGTPIGTATLSAGTAMVQTSSLGTGPNSLTVVYGGDPTHDPSTSAPVTVTVDATAPSVPAGLTATPQSTWAIQLAWSASTESGYAVKGYDVYRDGALIATTVNTTFDDRSGLTPWTAYTYQVAAYDVVGNASALSTAVTVRTLDTTPPTMPGLLTAQSPSPVEVTLTWEASTDPYSPFVYDVYRDGAQIASTTATTYADTGVTAGTLYTYDVIAVDQSGNSSPPSRIVEAAAGAPVMAGLPVVAGTVAVGQTLTGSHGVWYGTGSMTYGFQWYRCDTTGANCGAIGKSTWDAYTIGTADQGHTLRLLVVASDPAGATQVYTAATATVG